MERLYYFGLPFDDVGKSEALEKVEDFLKDGDQHYLTTPNPEMVVRAHHDEHFTQALRGSHLAIVDGFGLQLAFYLYGGTWVKRNTGIEFLKAILEKFAGQSSFFFLGAEHGVSHEAARVAHLRYGARVVETYEPRRGTYDASQKLTVLDKTEHQALLARIQASEPDILVVALGHGLQEKWMAEYLRECPSVRVAIGVGGALDYLSEKTPRAPSLWRRFGFEWLWRLSTQPSRYKRIVNAVVVFPMLALAWQLSSLTRYRPSVVGCVINHEGKILLVSRPEDATHWQFPQGGQEKGESSEQAILREMREELGTDKLEIIGRSKPNVYRYSWKRSWKARRYSGDTDVPVRRYGYRGQKQTIFYLRFLGKDRHIKLDTAEHTAYKWIEPSHLIAVIHPVRRNLAAIILRDFHEYYHA